MNKVKKIEKSGLENRFSDTKHTFYGGHAKCVAVGDTVFNRMLQENMEKIREKENK